MPLFHVLLRRAGHPALPRPWEVTLPSVPSEGNPFTVNLSLDSLFIFKTFPLWKGLFLYFRVPSVPDRDQGEPGLILGSWVQRVRPDQLQRPVSEGDRQDRSGYGRCCTILWG